MSRAHRRREARAKRKRDKTKGQLMVWCPLCGRGFKTAEDCIDHQDRVGHVIEV